MTKRDIVVFLFKWKGTLLSTFLLVVVLVASLVYLLPPAYKAKSIVLIESIQAISTRTDPMPGVDMPIVLKTESQVVLSRPVLEAVVDEIRPHEIPSRRTWIAETRRKIRNGMVDVGLLSATSPRDGWITSLADDVEVKPVAGSNILEIKYAHEDPRLAAALVNAITRAYINHHVEIYAARGVTEFYQEQAQKSKASLDELNSKIDSYRAKFPVSDVADTSDGLSRTLETLRTQASRLKSEAIELSAAYSDSHPKVRVVRAKLANVEATIRATEEKTARLQRRDADIDLMRTMSDSQRTNYLNLLKLVTQAKTTELANPSTTNVRVVQYATVPASPGHSRLFFIALAVIGGSALAFALAFVREYFDQRIRGIDVAEALLGLPILGAVPEHSVRRRLRRRR